MRRGVVSEEKEKRRRDVRGGKVALLSVGSKVLLDWTFLFRKNLKEKRGVAGTCAHCFRLRNVRFV